LFALFGTPACFCGVQHGQLILQILQLLLLVVPVVQVLRTDDAEQALDGDAPWRCPELADRNLEFDFTDTAGGDFDRQIERAEGIFAYGYVLELNFACGKIYCLCDAE